MKKHLYTPILVFYVLFLFLSSGSWSQAIATNGQYAGPDKHTCKNNSGQTLPVKIGPGASREEYCYSWTPVTGLDNPNTANPTATPSVTTVYTVLVEGDNFKLRYTDQMTVYVDQLQSLVVTPKQCCFKVGETFRADQFNISTVPAGLEADVAFDPVTAPALIGLPDQDVTITVKTRCVETGDPISTTVVVKVVDQEQWTTVQINVGDVEAALAKLEEVTQSIINGTNKAPVPCALSEPAVTRQYGMSSGKMCCVERGCEEDRQKVFGNFKYCWGFSCFGPILGIPGIASIDLTLGDQFCITIALDYKTNCDGGDVCLTGTVDLKFPGGLAGRVLGGKALSASLTLEPQVSSPPIQICIPSLKTQFLGPLCAQVDIVGSVTFVGAFTSQVKYNLISKKCFTP